MATEVAIDALGKEWKGYVVQIMIITMKFCLETKCLGPRRLCLLLIIDQGELVIQYTYIIGNANLNVNGWGERERDERDRERLILR